MQILFWRTNRKLLVISESCTSEAVSKGSVQMREAASHELSQGRPAPDRVRLQVFDPPTAYNDGALGKGGAKTCEGLARLL
jgi:hypothetical protein